MLAGIFLKLGEHQTLSHSLVLANNKSHLSTIVLLVVLTIYGLLLQGCFLNAKILIHGKMLTRKVEHLLK